jgi:hypothetical protein
LIKLLAGKKLKILLFLTGTLVSCIIFLEILGRFLDPVIFSSDKPLKNSTYEIGLNDFSIKVEEIGIFSRNSAAVLAIDNTNQVKYVAERNTGKVISVNTQALNFEKIDSFKFHSEYRSGKVFIFDLTFKDDSLYVSLEDFNGTNCDIYKIVVFKIKNAKFGMPKEIWRHSKPCVIYSKSQPATNFSGRILVDNTFLYLAGGLLVDDNLDFVKPGLSANTFSVRDFIDKNKIYGAITRINLNTGISIQISKGHRVPQGLAMLKRGTKSYIFETEHGPRGGDELNQIEIGKNYGWPSVSWGSDYIKSNNTIFKIKFTSHINYSPPIYFWADSIGVSQISELNFDVIDSTWAKGDLLVASLKASSLYRLKLDLNKSSVISIDSVNLNRRLRSIISSNEKIFATTDSGSLLVLTPLNIRTNGQFPLPTSPEGPIYKIFYRITHPFEYLRDGIKLF